MNQFDILFTSFFCQVMLMLMMKRMKCQSRLSHFGLLLLVVAAAAVELVSCVEYVTLKGTEASTPPMK